MSKLAEFEIRSMPGLWQWYDQSARQLAFSAGSVAEAEVWQDTLRGTLTRLLGVKHEVTCDLDAHMTDSGKGDGFAWELVVIQTRPGEYTPVYVLIPDKPVLPYKPVIALHGHGNLGARGLVGIAANEEEAGQIKRLNYDYARQYALRGHLVFAPVQRGFAERLEQQIDPVLPTPDEPPSLSSCKPLGMNALMRGETLLGLRVWDAKRLIDYIRTRTEPMTETLGCVGLSGGGTATLFTTALDKRITAAVVSCYFNTFRDSIMSIDHCVCNYVPGILQYAEMSDIGGLIAPRPLLIESGSVDPIFPIDGTKRGLSALRPIYSCFGVDDHLDADFFEGGHQWSGKKAYDWLAKWL